jgi:hypothetical protein
VKTALSWTPFPGHHPGQAAEDRFYGESTYRGMSCSIFEYKAHPEAASTFEWSFYDPEGGPMDDPDIAIALGEPVSTFEESVDDMLDYIDGYVEGQR